MAFMILHDFFGVIARESSPFWRGFLYLELILIGAILFGLIEGVLYWGLKRLIARSARPSLTRQQLDTLVEIEVRR